MGAFFVYIVKTAICLAMFYLFYRLLLSRETFHRFNRIALLSILFLSCVIPFIEITVDQPTPVNQHFLTLEDLLLMSTQNNNGSVKNIANTPLVTWREIILMGYLLGIVFFFFRNLWSLSHMLCLIKRGRIEKQENGIILITHQKEIAPFSWMKFVVISETDLQENGDEILTHEYEHIEKHHSIDLLIADICIFFQWFNPASWLLKQELQNIHEFEADESVIKKGIDAKKYQLLLIKKAVGTRLYSMANSLNHSSLKKRIAMMIKKKSNPWARVKYIYVLPLVAIAVTAFARPEISEEINEISAIKVNDLAAIVKAEKSVNVTNRVEKEMKVTKKVSTKDSIVAKKKDSSEDAEIVVVGYVNPNSQQNNTLPDRVYTKVEKMPEFPGGTQECLKFIANNIRYPVQAQEKGIQGKSIIQFTVEKDGSITSPNIMRSVNSYLDTEAMRVIMLMPKWIPGEQNGETVRVQYTLPVLFKLSENRNNDKHMRIRYKPLSEQPLFIVDGKEAAGIDNIMPDNIESIQILKDSTAICKYGEKGKNGVILLKTKKK